MDEIIKIDKKDPNKETKVNLYAGATRLVDSRNAIKRDQESLLLSVGTLFFGIFLSTYLNTILSYLVFGIVLLILLILAINKNNKYIQRIRTQYNILVKEGDKVNINLRKEF